MKNLKDMNNTNMLKRLFTLVFVLGMGMATARAYSFSAVAPSGQMLYYNIINSSEHTVGVVTTGNNTYISGDVVVPSTVMCNGVEYTVTALLNPNNNGSFQGTSITSLTLPSTINNVQGAAFYMCSSLHTIAILAETPPSLSGNTTYATFQGLPSDCVLFVPVGTSSAYTTAWGGFNGSIIESQDSQISAFVHPEGCGTITGTGTYEFGNTCVLMATANDGFSFLCWTENGRVVSRDASYSFTVFHDRALVANFSNNLDYIAFADANVKALCVANWDSNGDGELSYTEALAVTSLGVVFKSNTNIAAFDELQYFIGLNSINANAFLGCSGLTSLEIPNSVTAIGQNAFQGCSGLTGELVIPNSVSTIGESAFSSCHGFTSLIIGNSVTTINNYGFNGMTGLTSIAVLAETPPAVTGGYWGYEAFRGVSTSIPVYVPCESAEAYQSATGWNSFTNINAVCSASITASASSNQGGTVAGDGTFDFGATCTLTVTPNPGYHFWYWTENGVVVSNDASYSFTVVHDRNLVAVFSTSNPADAIQFADANVKALCVANWDSNGDGELSYNEAQMVTFIGNVFKGNTEIGSFDELQYFTGLNSIDAYAFQGCNGLTSVTIPNAVTSIRNSAFSGCSGLTSLEIPNSVTAIGQNAFQGCSGLTGELVIPNSVISIQNNAFSGCSGLTSVAVLAETPPTVGSSAFSGVSTGIPVYVPCESAIAYQNASGWNNFSNITAVCTSTIEASVLPITGGSVTGGGTFDFGATCTLTATPNSGYYFWYWTENEAVVSNSASYSFTVVGDCDLVAVFSASNPADAIQFADTNVKTLCVANWDRNGDGELSYAEAGSVLSLGNIFKGNFEIAAFDELQYFIGLNSINANAFQGCSGLTSVEIPNSVIMIGQSAFNGCSGLTSVEIPNSVIMIGQSAFNGCSGLTSVEIPNSVTTIGGSAFHTCSGLTSVNYTGDIAQWCEISFGDNASNPLYYAHNLYVNNQLVTDLVIPNSATTIGNFAFQNCSGLISVEIPNSVTAIGQNAFSGCSSLTLVEIPNSVTSIGNSAFYNCSGLTSVEIPNSVTTIGSSAFSLCSGLTSVTIGNSVTTIGSSAFYNCSGLTSVEIPNSVTTIGSFAFQGCSSLTSVTIGNSVTSIFNDAFKNCNGLTSVHYTGDVAQWCGIVFNNELSNPLTIAHELFINNTLVTNLVISNSVTSIGSYAFYNCNSLASVDISNSVTTIGNYAFYNCNDLAEVIIGEGVNSIGTCAFWLCPNLVEVHFNAINCTTMTSSGYGNYNQSITMSTFNGNGYTPGAYPVMNVPMSTLIIGNNVENIPSQAFYCCSGLTSVTIPNSVTSIGNSAFYNCSGLTSVAVLAETPPSGSGGFNTAIPVRVPCASLEAYQSANGWSNFTNIVGVCTGSIAVSASQAEGGTVEGAGTYDFGTSCIVTATANTGYHFWYWTEDDIVVSTDASYAFNVIDDRELVAVFSSDDPLDAIVFADADVKALCVANWDTNGDGELSYLEAAEVSSIRNVFQGNTSIDSFDELQFFVVLRKLMPNVFSGCSNLTSVTIPNFVTSIGDNAFKNCSGLTSVTIPNSVTTIGSYVFSDCSSLTSVTIGNSVTSIGTSAFSNCSGMTSVTIGNSVTSIGSNAFYNCSGLTSVYYTGDIAQWCGITFYGSFYGYSNPLYYGHNLFIGNELVTDVFIPNTITTIGHYTFQGCSCLTSVTISNTVTSIGNYAFQGCSGLTGELVIPNSVTAIGGYAFYGCSGLTSVTIPNAVTSIGNYAFQGCSGLTSVEIPNSVTAIGGYAFYGCSGLTLLTIGEGVTSIGECAFWDCPSLTTLNFNAINCTMYHELNHNYYSEFSGDGNGGPILVETLNIGEHVTRIPTSAFKNFRSITSLEIPNSVTYIGNEAFFYCTSLTSLIIGNSVTGIGESAFAYCGRLASMVIFAETPPSICNGSGSYNWHEFVPSFMYVPSNIIVYVPCGSITAYEGTGWRRSYTEVITNFVEMCPYEINVSVTPAGAAAIEGAGTYNNTETCTLGYEATYGYGFLNWMENGEVVSTDDTYSFVVTEDHNITANFQYIEQHWPLPQGYEGNMTLTGIITIDGEEQTSDFIELAAFIGDECHGTALPINVNGQRVYFLTIMGDNADEGVALEFKLYDHQQQEELDLLCTNTINYQHDAVYGLDEFYVLNFLNYVVITATADPAEGGTIEGTGNHFPGLEATLTATANTGYTFQNWTKNGTVVSTNAAYTFTVTEAESYVAHFTLNSYELTVSADPTEGGSVTGGGTYNHFDECTLTATANTGYTFQNWTLNDEVVSTDAEYTFEVSGGGEYVAHFQLNSYEIAATADPAEGGTIEGAGTYNHFETCTLTATAATGYTFQNWTLEGEEVSTATELSLEVNAPAAYVAHFTLNSYEITAIANPAQGGTVSGGGTYNHFASCTLMATAAEGYQFNRWVADGTTVSTDATYTFEVSGPATITAMFDLVQTVTMSNGWTWWGTSVELTSLGNDGGLGVLEQGLGDYGIIIKHGPKYVQNYSSFGYGWMGTLEKLENEKGYKIQTTQSCDVTITGPLAEPGDHPIELVQGWNWIGYPVVQAQSVSSALAGLTPTSGDIIKGQGPFSTYYEGMGWLPEFNLEPGKGYLYYSGNEENQTFTYANAGSKSAIVAVDDRHWRNDVHAYADNLCLWAVVSIGGEEQRTESLELGAFVDGECRGSAKLMYVAPFDRYYALMTVAGESGETIEFALLDEAHNQVSTDCTCHITFVNDAIVGGFETPYQVDFGTMTVIGEYASNLYMYPNPVARNAAFNLVLPEDETVAELYIVDMKGAVVRHETGAISHHSISGLPTSGLYVIRAVCKSGKVYQSRLAVD